MANTGCIFIEKTNSIHLMILKVKTFIALLVLLSGSHLALAQQPVKKQNANPELRKGNELYKEKKYKEAQMSYANALQKDPTSKTGMFNLGDALYKSKDYDNARKTLEASAKATTDRKEQARAYHNIGNSYMEEKKWDDAINAYKQSLKLNPSDADTKYNLAYANAMMKKDGGGKNNKDKNKDKKDQDKKDKDKKDQNKKDQDKKDQDKKDGDKDNKDQPKQQPQAQPSKLTKEQANQMLNALQQDEKKLQDKKDKGKGVPIKMEKDW